jgi:hypothetical protein
MNNGLSSALRLIFPNVIPVPRPSVTGSLTIDPNWLAGFTDAEGCFNVRVSLLKGCKAGSQVQLRFILSQHSRDRHLINSLLNYFNCGMIEENPKRSVVDFRVSKFEDIIKKIIPMFNSYPLIGVKSRDFQDFCRVVELMKNKVHLTQEGVIQIRDIKDGMNIGREKDKS